MPYILPEDRVKYDEFLDKMPIPQRKGDLEYCVFKLMELYRSCQAGRYSDLHDCTYAVQHCADEFRRLYLDKREDAAREANGDVL